MKWRLRPAPHARTPILSYSLTALPEKHFINWQQDPYGNYIARFVFPEQARELSFSVDLVADMTVINPFDFFVEQYAEKYPFQYTKQLKYELAPYLMPEPTGPRLAQWIQELKREELKADLVTQDFLVTVNRRLQRAIAYLVRMEAGVQTPEETLANASGRAVIPAGCWCRSCAT
jgi:transglutaminase-like putative cysteine protease